MKWLSSKATALLLISAILTSLVLAGCSQSDKSGSAMPSRSLSSGSGDNPTENPDSVIEESAVCLSTCSSNGQAVCNCEELLTLEVMN